MDLILVIDDKKESRLAIRELLQENGYEVMCAMDGNHALDKISQRSFAAAVMEATLAGTSGMEVLRRIRRVAPQLPVIIVTEHPSPEAEWAFAQLGAHAYLPQTTFRETLPKKVQSAIESTLRGRTPGAGARASAEL